MTIDLDAKLDAVAKIVEGRVIKDDERVPVCVKGSVFGFPVALESVYHGWPFGLTYVLETHVIDDPAKRNSDYVLNMTLYPRIGRGLLSFFSHILLFEAQGQPVGDKRLESQFVFSYNDAGLAERFVKYPGMHDNLVKLAQYSKFTELTVKTDAGLMLSQPTSFNALDLDVCRETFRLLGEIGQAVFDSF